MSRQNRLQLTVMIEEKSASWKFFVIIIIKTAYELNYLWRIFFQKQSRKNFPEKKNEIFPVKSSSENFRFFLYDLFDFLIKKFFFRGSLMTEHKKITILSKDIKENSVPPEWPYSWELGYARSSGPEPN